MATMDIIKLHGGSPANFLDVGGSVQEDQVYHAFRILTAGNEWVRIVIKVFFKYTRLIFSLIYFFRFYKDPNVKGILVNVFGGIVNCATIANGIVNASRNINLSVPLIVRLEGKRFELL